MEYDNSAPIYVQLMTRLRQDVAAGRIAPGEKIGSVREMAQAFKVNPNTVQKALSELEREGLLRSEGTAGRFVTDDAQRIRQAREEMGEECVRQFVRQMTRLGYSPQELGELLSGAELPS